MNLKGILPICFLVATISSRAGVVTWDAGGDGSNWDDAQNWSGDAVPTPTDEVVIGAGAPVSVSAPHTMLRLQSQRAIVVTAGSLTFTAGASEVHGSVSLALGTALAVSGAGTSFVATNTVSADGASFYVSGGGQIRLPGLQQATKLDGCYDVMWQAEGAGSVLDLSSVTNFSGGDCFSMNLRAVAGGQVLVSKLETISNGFVSVMADGAGSLVDLGKLASFPSADRLLDLEARNGGQVRVPSMVDAGRTRVTLRHGGFMDTAQFTRLIGVTVDDQAVALPAITNVDRASLVVENGGRLSLPLVTQVTKPDGCYGVEWRAEGAGSVLDLSSVTNLYGGDCFTMNLRAVAGGQVLVGNLETISNGFVSVMADGAGSLVDLGKLVSFSSADRVLDLEARSGGQVRVPSMVDAGRTRVTLRNGGLMDTAQFARLIGVTVENQALILPALTNVDQASLFAGNGGKLSLPRVTQVAKSDGCYDMEWRAEGPGSVVDLSSVTNLYGGDCFHLNLRAMAGGQVLVSSLETISNGFVWVMADGAGSLVDLVKLASFSSADRLLDLEARNGGEVRVPLMVDAGRTRVTLRNGGLMDTAQFTRLLGVTVDNQGLVLPALTNVDQASLSAENGGRLALPLVTQVTKSDGCYDVVWRAEGAGSVLDLSAVTNLYGGNCFYMNLRAVAGGQVLVGNLETISNGYVSTMADGAGSLVDLGKLASFPSVDRLLDLEARNGGQVRVPSMVDAGRTLITLRNGGFMDTAQFTRLLGVTVENQVLVLPAITNVDRASFFVGNAGKLSLPRVTQVTKWDGCYDVVWQAEGAGSVLDLSSMTNLYGGDCFYMNLRAVAGGQVLVGNLETISNGFVSVMADGAGSLVDLDKLASFPSANRLLDLEARSGGEVRVPLMVDAGRTRITLRNGGLMDTAQFTRLLGVMVDNQVLVLPALTNVDQASLSVENGGRLALPVVTQVTKSDGCYEVVWRAEGAGSVLDLSAVTNLYGGNCFSMNLRAVAGGQILAGQLETISNGFVWVMADGAGSLVDLGKLVSFSSADRVLDLEARSGGEVRVPLMVDAGRTRITLRHGGLMDTAQFTHLFGVTVDDQVLSLPGVTRLDDASLSVVGGGLLQLPSLTSVVKSPGCLVVTWQASGVGSRIEAPVLATLSGGDCFSFNLLADSGGQLILDALTAIHGFGFFVKAEGEGSVVDLSRLTEIISATAGPSSIATGNNGRIQFNPLPFVMLNVNLHLPSSGPGLAPIDLAAPNIVVHGIPWRSYLLEQRRLNQPDAPWEFFRRVPQMADFQKAFGTPPANTSFRVTEFVADPPVLELSILSEAQAQVLVYGTPTHTYQVESAPDLGPVPPIQWTPGDVVTMTNAFRFMPPTPATDLSHFFRAIKR